MVARINSVMALHMPVVSSQPEGGGGGSVATEKPAILCVEDNDLIRNMVSRAFARSFSVTVACNGREALDILQREGGRFRLVLTDVDMPVMTGLELVEALNSGEAPQFTGAIMVMSGKLSHHIDQITKLGVPEANCLEKPFTGSEAMPVILGVLSALK